MASVQGTVVEAVTEPRPACCWACGSEWFELIDAVTGPAQLTFDVNGHVTGWSGQPVCGGCGEAWHPRQRHLRAVE